MKIVNKENRENVAFSAVQAEDAILVRQLCQMQYSGYYVISFDYIPAWAAERVKRVRFIQK